MGNCWCCQAWKWCWRSDASMQAIHPGVWKHHAALLPLHPPQSSWPQRQLGLLLYGQNNSYGLLSCSSCLIGTIIQHVITLFAYLTSPSLVCWLLLFSAILVPPFLHLCLLPDQQPTLSYFFPKLDPVLLQLQPLLPYLNLVFLILLPGSLSLYDIMDVVT